MKIDDEHHNLNPSVISFISVDENILVTIKTNGRNNNIHFDDKNEGEERLTVPRSNFIKLLKGEFFKEKGEFYLYWDEILS